MYWNRIQFWKQHCSIIEFWIYFNRQNLKNLFIFRFSLAISSRSRYSKKIFYFETTFLSTLPLLSSRKACFQSRNIRLARLIGLTRWAISPETPPSDAVCPPLPLPVHERRGNEIYSRGIVARGAPLSGWLSSCRGTTEGGGGYRGAWYPLPPPLSLEVALPARKLHVLPCYKFNLGWGDRGRRRRRRVVARVSVARTPPSCSCILSLRLPLPCPPLPRSVLIAIRVFDA